MPLTLFFLLDALLPLILLLYSRPVDRGECSDDDHTDMRGLVTARHVSVGSCLDLTYVSHGCSRVSNSRCRGFSFRMPDPRPTARLHRGFFAQGCAICPMAQMNPRSSR